MSKIKNQSEYDKLMLRAECLNNAINCLPDDVEIINYIITELDYIKERDINKYYDLNIKFKKSILPLLKYIANNMSINEFKENNTTGFYDTVMNNVRRNSEDLEMIKKYDPQRANEIEYPEKKLIR